LNSTFDDDTSTFEDEEDVAEAANPSGVEIEKDDEDEMDEDKVEEEDAKWGGLEALMIVVSLDFSGSDFSVSTFSTPRWEWRLVVQAASICCRMSSTVYAVLA